MPGTYLRKIPKFLEFYGASTGAETNTSKSNCKELQGPRRMDGRQAGGHVNQGPMERRQRGDSKVKNMTELSRQGLQSYVICEWTNQKRLKHLVDVTQQKLSMTQWSSKIQLEELTLNKMYDEISRSLIMTHCDYHTSYSINRGWNALILMTSCIIVSNGKSIKSLVIPIKGSIEKTSRKLIMAAWYHETELKATVRGTQEIPTIFRGLREGNPESLFVAESITVGDAYTEHRRKNANARSDDLILEAPMAIPAGVRPHNSLMLEANDIEKIKESFVKVGCLGFIKWNCDSKKKVHWVQFVFRKHWCCYIRLYPRMISDLDPIKEFVSWDFMQMSVICLKRPGDKDENNEMVEKHRLVYNSSWPIEAMMHEIITKHYNRWHQDEHDLLVEMMRNPKIKVSTRSMLRPNKDDYSINAFIKDRPDLKSWANDFREKDRLKQAQKFKASLNMPQWGGVDTKFEDIYTKVQSQAEQLGLLLAERTREQTRLALMEKERMELMLKERKEPGEADSGHAKSTSDKGEDASPRKSLPRPNPNPFNSSATPNGNKKPGNNSKSFIKNVKNIKLAGSKKPRYMNILKGSVFNATPIPPLEGRTPTPSRKSQLSIHEEAIELFRMNRKNSSHDLDENILENIVDRKKSMNRQKSLGGNGSQIGILDIDNEITPTKNTSQPEKPRGYDPTKLTEEEEDEEVQMCAMKSVASKANSSSWDVKWSSNIDGLDDDQNETQKVSRICEWVNQTQERTKEGRHTGKYKADDYAFSKIGDDDISMISGISITNSNYAPSKATSIGANSSITNQYAPVMPREWDSRNHQEMSLHMTISEELNHTQTGPKESTPARKSKGRNVSIKGNPSKSATNKTKEGEPAENNEEYDAKAARSRRLKNIQAKAREQAEKDNWKKNARQV